MLWTCSLRPACDDSCPLLSTSRASPTSYMFTRSIPPHEVPTCLQHLSPGTWPGFHPPGPLRMSPSVHCAGRLQQRDRLHGVPLLQLDQAGAARRARPARNARSAPAVGAASHPVNALGRACCQQCQAGAACWEARRQPGIGTAATWTADELGSILSTSSRASCRCSGHLRTPQCR